MQVSADVYFVNTVVDLSVVMCSVRWICVYFIFQLLDNHKMRGAKIINSFKLVVTLLK